ncbi:MAG: hypothetical protein ACTSRS_05120 [Candidatus Helarchaeota archaeon]
MSVLKNYLNSNEQVIDRLAPIRFKEIIFQCALTNSRICLYTEDGKRILDFDYKSIKQLSLEKEWYDEFHLGAIFALLIGSIWSIAGFIYQYIDNPSLIPEINVIRALFYPGLGFLSLGIVSMYLFYSKMKTHILICTPNEKFQLFSNSKTLHELQTIYENIKSKEIVLPEGDLSEISDKDRLSEEYITVFEDIDVKITFKDENTHKRSIHMKFQVKLSENLIHLTSKRVLTLKRSTMFDKYTKGQRIPLITESNLFKFFTIAKELGINWILLTTFNFMRPTISPKNYHFLTGFTGPESIILIVNSYYGQIALELKKTHLLTNTIAPEIIEIKKIIEKYSKDTAEN